MRLLPTTIVGSYPQPEWLIDRSRLASRFPPRVRARELWRVAPEYLQEAQDDATILAIKAQEEAGIDIITDGEMRRESYSNRFATALDGVDIDNPGSALDRSGHPNPVPRVTGPIRRRHAVEVEDVKFLRRHTARKIKISVPGPFTMAQQAQIDYYDGSRELAAMDYAAAVNAEIRDLFLAGADVVQIDEPYMQARPEEARAWGQKALNRALEGRRRGHGGAHLFWVCRDHPYASKRIFVLIGTQELHLRSDLDRDRPIQARLLGAARIGRKDDHARRHRFV
ncbi:MAG TPA: hypothetical protein VGO37_10670 [Steroidobacteraceae bacterium]|jgi:5-methyltetrahydropteroyltriglutamate--homocysteine methyltransferase|nr:hypothetical protein [Steroidobacteraceae bacterium]